MDKVYNTLAQDFLYKDPTHNCIMLDNHDTDRFFSTVGESVDKYKMGMAWLMTERGIPEVYYGDEILMKNIARPSGGDGMVRIDFPGGWPGDATNKFAEAGRTPAEKDAFGYVRSPGPFQGPVFGTNNGEADAVYLPEDRVYTYFR